MCAHGELREITTTNMDPLGKCKGSAHAGMKKLLLKVEAGSSVDLGTSVPLLYITSRSAVCLR